MRRLAEHTGLIPIEFPTTRQLGATAESRAADINAAFADPQIRAVISTTGGDDEVTVVPHVDTAVIKHDPKPFFGYSDNTNLHHLLWGLGVPSFYGGSTQVHLGAGPHIDDIHLQSLRAALLDGGAIELTDPGISEDYGVEWEDPKSLQEFGRRESTEPWTWAGPGVAVEGRTWGGCLEVIDQIAIAGRMPEIEDVTGKILIFETSEEVPPAIMVKRSLRSLGERGIFAAAAGVIMARPPVSELRKPVPPPDERDRLRKAQRDTVIAEVQKYNPEAVICVGVPFGHTRPQWILPHGGTIRLDGAQQRITADYS
jgi:muramoyltetrapeptide carboxypeptidase LdcA involved in peptidoglycan recycling